VTAGHHGASLVVKAIAVGVVATAALCGAVRGAHPGAGNRVSVRPLPDAVDASLIPNYVRIGPALATGGRPTDAGLRRLRRLGFRVVIDLRTGAEGIAAERAAVTAAGLRYVSVPVTPESFRREDVETVAAILYDPNRGPVLLHCVSGNRAGGLWTALQVTRGRTYAAAEAEGRRIGLQSPAMIAAVRRVLHRPPDGR
jgi:uncharacterized protein (TIGR01244 family)